MGRGEGVGRSPTRDAEAARARRKAAGVRQEGKCKGMGPGPSLQGMLELPLLRRLDAAPGGARPRDLYEGLAGDLGLDPARRDEERSCSDGQSYNVFEQAVRWARQNAVARGLVAGPRGRWELTQAGGDRLGKVRRGTAVLVYSLDDGLGFWAHAEEAPGFLADGSVRLVMTSPPYPGIRREYGTMPVDEWLRWMSGLVGLWKRIVAPDGTIAVNLGDVHVPGSPCISPYVERFTLDAIDRHGLHLAGRMPWHNPGKMGHIEWCSKRGVVPRATVEHVVLLSPSPAPAWDAGRLPPEPYAARSDAALAGDARRAGTSARRPTGHEFREDAFRRDGVGRMSSNLIVSGGGSGGTYGRKCREEGLSLHPARFPEELPRRVMLLTTAPGDVVYDPMAGSGTTCKVARSLGRRFVASEPMLDYCRGQALRFEDAPGFSASWPVAGRGAAPPG